MNKPSLLLCCSVAVLLAACGGGGDAEVPAPQSAADAVPDSASQSPAGMAEWLTALTTTMADEKEPLDVAKFNPPQPEDTEPEALK